MKILFLTHDLAHGGGARQLTLLASALPRPRFNVQVFTAGADTPWSLMLRNVGIPVASGQRRRLVDLRAFLALRQTVRDVRPDVIHVFGLPALRALALTGGRRGARVVLSETISGERATPLGRLDRWLIGTLADRVTVRGAAQAEHHRRLGVPAAKLVEIAPGVPLAVAPKVPHPEWCRSLGLPERARTIVAIGPLEPARGFRDAIWAFDILRYVQDDLHLLLIGTGSQETRLREFVQITRSTGLVHFLGHRDDLDEILGHAQVVWVPSHADRGSTAALEAMAAGWAVVAARWPGLAEVIAEGETGVLVPPGDQASLARETRLLLDDPERCRRLGEAGRQRVAEHFSVQDMVQRFEAIYATVAANRAGG